VRSLGGMLGCLEKRSWGLVESWTGRGGFLERRRAEWMIFSALTLNIRRRAFALWINECRGMTERLKMKSDLERAAVRRTNTDHHQVSTDRRQKASRNPQTNHRPAETRR
jgi:hypothetical protein